MNRPNYQKQLDAVLSGMDREQAPDLFLHSCCAPCSSYVLKYLREFFKITVFYYNPNISMEEEYRKRVEEQKRLIAVYNEEAAKPDRSGYPVSIVEGDYEPGVFLELAKAYAQEPEGGKRCFLCYELRLRRTAEEAVKRNFKYFCTTLSVSPLKNAEKLNEIGSRIGEELGIQWLPSDFKKRDGYRQSVELSHTYGLYRQNYCGCVYSKTQRELKDNGG